MARGPGEEPAPHPGHVFARLGELLYRGPEFPHTYQAICAAAPRLVDGCDHASLMVRRRHGLETVAATDEVARSVDQLELRVGAGPCVDAILDETPQFLPDIDVEGGPWPQLRRLVLAETPVRGMLGFRILHGGVKLASLNLFSDRAHGFPSHGVDQAAILAAFCSVAMRAGAERQQVATLRSGLESNREIGKAIGLLMAHHRIDDDTAYAILRRTSNDLNLKVSAVAQEILQGHRDQVDP